MKTVQDLEREITELKTTVARLAAVVFSTSAATKKLASGTGIDICRPRKVESTKQSTFEF